MGLRISIENVDSGRRHAPARPGWGGCGSQARATTTVPYFAYISHNFYFFVLGFEGYDR